jgi:nitroimidazol reductase NimA-like FMN-containing flavoprotein (pyridoxamine 5'-phosphate oxidase superfamily)
MSSQQILQNALDYIKETRFAQLNYIRQDGTPVTRTLGSVAVDGKDIFFSTRSIAKKTSALKIHPKVSLFFEKDAQEPSKWKNVLVSGTAEAVTIPSDKLRAVQLLSSRNQRLIPLRDALLNGVLDSQELRDTTLFKITSNELQFLDRETQTGQTVTIALESKE